MKSLFRIIWVIPFFFLGKTSLRMLMRISRHPTLIKSYKKNLCCCDEQVTIGNPSNSNFFTYSFINVRFPSKGIFIKKNTKIGNNFTAISLNEIKIGKNCLIGSNVKLLDSDFHSVNKDRKDDHISSKKIEIKDNVFIGDNVLILKGVIIGNNCTIGAGSVVTKSFPDDTILAGNPARAISFVQ